MGSEELYKGVPVQVALRELASPEWTAIAKLAGYLTDTLQDRYKAELDKATPMDVVDLAIQIIESSRKLTVATYEALEPRLREMLRRIATEESHDGA